MGAVEDGLKTLIIGQAPSRTTVGAKPFSGRSGPKFAELLGVAHARLWDEFEVVNLIDYFPGDPADATKRGDAFPRIEARSKAASMRPGMVGRRVVMVGKNVAQAFRVDPEDFFSWEFDRRSSFRYCVVPHPSGISHFWNDPNNVLLARSFMGQIPR